MFRWKIAALSASMEFWFLDEGIYIQFNQIFHFFHLTLIAIEASKAAQCWAAAEHLRKNLFLIYGYSNKKRKAASSVFFSINVVTNARLKAFFDRIIVTSLVNFQHIGLIAELINIYPYVHFNPQVMDILRQTRTSRNPR